MFFPKDRDAVLDSLTLMGGSVCGYCIDPATWHTVRCDCKYGGPARFGSEQTGCPELRATYAVIATMADAEWDDLAARAGGVTPAQLLEAFSKPQESDDA